MSSSTRINDLLIYDGSLVPSIYTVSTIVGVLMISLLVYLKRCHSYWRSRNIPGPSPSVLVGNSLEMMATPFIVYEKQLIDKYGDLVGIYDRWKPILLVNDADIVHEATVKQFQCFADRTDYNGNRIISDMLVSTNGDRWRHQRKLMSPAFTSSKIRSMNPLMLLPIDRLCKRMEMRSELDVRPELYTLSLQIIVRCAFGVDLPDGRECEVAVVHAAKSTQISNWKMLIALLCPAWLRKRIDFTIFNDDALAYFYKMAQVIVKQRKDNPQDKRDFCDFVDLLLQLGDDGGEALTADEMMANFVLFLIAGFETTASALSNCFFLLAHHPHVQDELRDSLSEFHLHDSQDIGEKVTALTYLDAVISEALRLYPPGIRTERIATQKVTLSNGLTVDEGTILAFCIHRLHRHPKYWSDPDTFNPQRFMPHNKDNLHQYAFMPFHLGPRNCIGKRFALNEIRFTLIQVIKKFKLLPSPRSSYPPDYSKSVVTLVGPTNEMWVRLQKI